MPALLSNNAVSRLAGSINTSDVQLSVSAGDGVKFPSPGAGQWFPLTLIRPDGSLELVRVTGRNGDVMTVLRGQEGTAPLGFSAGDRAELRVTAGVLNGKLDTDGGTVTGPVTLTADLTTYRPAAPATGVVFLGNSGSKYLFYDGANYMLPGGQLYVNGSQAWHTGNFNPANYLPLGGGTMTGNLTVSNTAMYITHYDTDWGANRHIHSNGGSIGFLTSGGGWAAYSDNAGNWIATANVGAYSDRRHKTDIETIDCALGLIERLRGVRYTRIRDGAKCVGVIAQEVQEVVPEVVGETPDGLYVDYGNLVAPLIGAVQELAGRVRKLEGR